MYVVIESNFFNDEWIPSVQTHTFNTRAEARRYKKLVSEVSRMLGETNRQWRIYTLREEVR